MEAKKRAAEGTIPFFKNKSLIGLGAGSTIAYVIEILNEHKNEFHAKFISSSFNTLQLLKENEFDVAPLNSVAAIDIYVDGCDQVDRNLNALKSGGGIHTMEKLLASMAKEFIIVGDEGKYVDEFDSKFPVVIDILPEALHYILAKLPMLYPGVKTAIRLSDKKDGPVITGNGNYLVDIWFERWPEPEGLHLALKSITGIIETSLFLGLAHKAILGDKDDIRVIEKSIR
jgi:ribose 5-phosphate isomerase A